MKITAKNINKVKGIIKRRRNHLNKKYKKIREKQKNCEHNMFVIGEKYSDYCNPKLEKSGYLITCTNCKKRHLLRLDEYTELVLLGIIKPAVKHKLRLPTSDQWYIKMFKRITGQYIL